MLYGCFLRFYLAAHLISSASHRVGPQKNSQSKTQTLDSIKTTVTSAAPARGGRPNLRLASSHERTRSNWFLAAASGEAPSHQFPPSRPNEKRSTFTRGTLAPGSTDSTECRPAQTELRAQILNCSIALRATENWQATLRPRAFSPSKFPTGSTFSFLDLSKPGLSSPLISSDPLSTSLHSSALLSSPPSRSIPLPNSSSSEGNRQSRLLQTTMALHANLRR